MNVFDQLKRDEGCLLEPYCDSKGILTIGYGHNLEADPSKEVPHAITFDQANEYLRADVANAQEQVDKHLPWAKALEPARYWALVNMAFNMGINKLLEFHHTLALLEQGDYAGAALEMKNSLWAKQVKERAERLAEQIKTGVWQ